MDKPSKQVGNYLSTLANKVKHDKMLKEGSETHEEVNYLLEEIISLKSMIRSLKRDVQNIVREELEDIMSEATLIQEGSADTMHIVLGKHHFKGKVSLVKK